MADVRAEHTGDFLRLAQLWEKRNHFSLLLAAVGDSAYRDALIRRLDGMVPSARIDLPPDATPEDWLNQIQNAWREGANRVQVCLPISPRRGDVWWQRANVIRERIAEAFPAPHLLWLADADADAAAHQAPDLWNWREGVFGFSSTNGPAERLTVPGERFSYGSSMDATALEARLRSIDARVAEHTEDDAAVAHLLLEAAEARHRLGHWLDAEQNARAAVAAFDRRGDQQGAARAKALCAEIAWRRGDPDGALKILRNSVLPVYEKLGDQRERAVTMGQIADMLQARGEFDEALRVRREEQLPVYEKLGDERSRAVTMGKIADVLQVRGQLDEALRIRRDEELPVYEKLGDQRARAVAISSIADVLRMQGQLDAALRTWREDALPTFERIGDQHARALTLGRIADVLEMRGAIDEALRLRREEELPVYEKLGDQHARALTMGKISDALRSKGALDESLKLLRDQVLPVFANSRDQHMELIARTKLAQALLKRGGADDRVEAERLLVLAHRSAKRLGLPIAAQISQIYRGAVGQDIPAEVVDPEATPR